MTRAGREPAEDVKRRLVAACQEVGLTVASARMHLIKEAGSRVVHVEPKVAGWSHESPTLSILASVKTSGDWPGSVDIRCVGSDVRAPLSRSRGRTPELGEDVRRHRTS